MGVAEKKGTPLGPSSIFFGPFLTQIKAIHPGNLEPFFIYFFFKWTLYLISENFF